MSTDTIISKIWSFCTPLKDDGLGYGDLPKEAHLPYLPQNGLRTSFYCFADIVRNARQQKNSLYPFICLERQSIFPDIITDI